MNAQELVNQLQTLGVRISVVGGALHVDAPAGVLNSVLRDDLVAQKAALLALLRRGTEVPGFHRGQVREAVADAGSPPNAGSNAETPTADTAPSLDRGALMRLRQCLPKGLRRWEDEAILALAHWHLAIAFDRAGERNWRRHLPPSLAALSDEEIEALINWPLLASLEQTSWATSPDAARALSRGGQRLATWWNARQAAKRAERERKTRA